MGERCQSGGQRWEMEGDDTTAAPRGMLSTCQLHSLGGCWRTQVATSTPADPEAEIPKLWDN